MFSEKLYGTPEGVASFNCYAYALNKRTGTLGYKLQPGELSGQGSSETSSTSCSVLNRRVMDDNRRRGIRKISPAARCPKGSYKIMAVQSTADPDFHFFRQSGDLIYRMRPGDTMRSVAKDFKVPPKTVVSPEPRPGPGALVFVKNAGVWSHKRGLSTGPLLRDAKNRVILDPRSGSFDYGQLKYSKFCGAMCINGGPERALPEERAWVDTLIKKLATK